MTQVQMIVTDVTKVGDERCVAGWNLNKRRMFRPGPRPGAFWPPALTESGAALEAGAIASFAIRAGEAATRYPHRTEDRIVTGEIVRIRAPNAGTTTQILRSIASPTIQHAFGGYVRVENERAFVKLDTKCASLGSINVRRHEFSLVEDVIEGKKRIRARLQIGNAVVYPTVTAIDVRTLHRKQGFQAVQRHLSRSNIIHLRLGLSRLFTGIDGRCYLQINGIYAIG
jgi:hypothetical protein